MEQTDGGMSTKTDPLWLYITAGVLIVCAIISQVIDMVQPPRIAHLIHWVPLERAADESRRTHKPVFYVFSAAWCGPCKRMESVAFGKPSIANAINANYVPVLVMDQSEERGKNPPVIDKLQKQCSVESFPTIVVVPEKLIDARTKDIYSTGNKLERQLVVNSLSWMHEAETQDEERQYMRWMDSYIDEMRDRVPAHHGYGSPADIERFLFACSVWHRVPPSVGSIKWHHLGEKNDTGKPTLLALVEDCGFESDHMRLNLFENEEAATLISSSFFPVLLEYKRDKHATNPAELVALRKKFGLKSLPGLVVEKGDTVTSVQDGFISRKHSMQFLMRAANIPEKSKASKEQSDEDSDE